LLADQDNPEKRIAERVHLSVDRGGHGVGLNATSSPPNGTGSRRAQRK